MSRTQFSLRTLLAAIAAVGIGAALWTAKPSWQVGAIEALLLPWVPASAVILSIYAKGRVKAFWIGVAAECITVCFMFFLIEGSYTNLTLMRHLGEPEYDSLQAFTEAVSTTFRKVLLTWAFAPVVGLLCVFTHWLLIRPPEPKD